MVRDPGLPVARQGLARVFVATSRASAVVRGYYSLSNHHVEHAALPEQGAKGLPHVDVPAILLGRLAVDRSSQGRGLGRFLLLDAMSRSLRVADATGVRVFEVHAIDEGARAFYLHHGLQPLEDEPDHLFVSMAAMRKIGL